MRRVVTVTLLMAAIGATQVPASRRETVALPGGSLRLAIPDRWARVPTEDLDALTLIAAEVSGGSAAEVFQAAFRPRTRPLRAGPPLLLIQANEGGRLSWGRLATLPMLDEARAASSRWLTASQVPFADATTIDRLAFDRDRHALRLEGRVDGTPWGEVAVSSTLLLTETGTVALHGLAPIGERDLFDGLWTSILATVHVDERIAYRPRLSDAWPWAVRQPSTWFALAGLAAAIAVWIAWRDRRSRTT